MDTDQKRFTVKVYSSLQWFTVNNLQYYVYKVMIIIYNFVQGVVGGIHLKGKLAPFPLFFFSKHKRQAI